MTRDEFTQGVFSRDNHLCVVPGCGKSAADAHHILERKLWLQDDPHPEGYLLDNGASLCEQHHIHAEAGHFPPEALRRWLCLETVLPRQLDPTRLWDKWGKEIDRAAWGSPKYPRTPYFNFSESQDEEDGYIDNSLLLNKPLVITLKMDGSNVNLNRERVAARNGQYATHPSFDYLKSLHAGFRYNIPEGIQLFGEWLFARHSIVYEGRKSLPSYLMIFAIYQSEGQLFWGWNEVKEFCEANGFTMAPEIGSAYFDAEWKMIKAVTSFSQQVIDLGHEGLVVKSAYPFHFTQHPQNVAKIVRPNHVQTDQHWSQQEVVRNELQEGKAL